MRESIFLSGKTVLLSEVLTGFTSQEMCKNLVVLLTRPIVVKDDTERVCEKNVCRSVFFFGSMKLADNRRGFIFSVSCIGSAVCGMYFIREGEKVLTEMVDPDWQMESRFVTVVEGERL